MPKRIYVVKGRSKELLAKVDGEQIVGSVNDELMAIIPELESGMYGIVVEEESDMELDKILIIDTALGLEHARKFGADGYETYYAVVNGEPYPKLQDEICGYGFSEIKKIDDWGEGLKEGCNVIVFIDSGFGHFADWLREKGYYVIGADAVTEKLELDRVFVRRVLEKLGIPIPDAKIVRGVKGVVDAVREADGKVFVKISRVRGDVETFGTDDPKEAEVILSKGLFRLLADNVLFVVEDKLEGLEIGIDTWFNGKEFIPIVAETIECKGCFDGDTEIFTDKGWVKFRDLTGNELVYTANLETGEFAFVKPKEIIKYHYRGKMLMYNGKQLKFIVTPNHTFYVKSYDKHYCNSSCKWSAKYAYELTESQWVIPKKFYWNGEHNSTFVLEPAYVCNTGKKASNNTTKEIDMVTWLRFLAWFLSEGFVNASNRSYCVTIVQMSDVGKERLESVLRNLPFEYTVSGKYYRIYSKQLSLWLIENCYTDRNVKRAWTKRVPDFVKRLSPDLIRVFLDEFVHGDGYICEDKGEYVYYTLSKQLADDLQELALKAGYYATVRKVSKDKIRATFEAKHDIYIVKITSMHNNHKVFNVFPNNWSVVDWDDYVYCVNVEPWHTIYVRKDGVPFWSGNSGNITTFKEIEESVWYDNLMKLEPYLRKNGYVGMFCLEGFYDGQEVKITDVTPRFPFICSMAYPKVIENYGEFMIGVAKGEDIRPKPIAKYSAQIGVYTDDPDTPRVIRYEGEDSEWLTYRRVIKVDGKIVFVPGDYVVAVAISASNSINEAFRDAIRRACNVEVPNSYTQGYEFAAYVRDLLEEAEKLGYEF